MANQSWLDDVRKRLARQLLPPEYYALPDQHAAGFSADVLTLEARLMPRPVRPDGRGG
jgi:hypothetical protein